MSRIYFHNKELDDAGLSGCERAYMGCLITDITAGLFQSMLRHDRDILNHISPNSFLRDSSRSLAEIFPLMLSSPLGDYLILNEEKVDLFVLCLNSAIKVGNEHIRLMARLHGQCEIHGYFMPEDFPYFSELIATGLENEIFREGVGWDKVKQLFDQAKSPIVTSYSVCDRFPGAHLTDIDASDDDSAWWQMDDDSQWDAAFSGIKNEKGLRIAPGVQLFGNGTSAFDFLRAKQKKSEAA